jgi:hypothetical protein
MDALANEGEGADSDSCISAAGLRAVIVVRMGKSKKRLLDEGIDLDELGAHDLKRLLREVERATPAASLATTRPARDTAGEGGEGEMIVEAEIVSDGRFPWYAAE